MRFTHRILAAAVVLAALAAIALVRPPRLAPIPKEALGPQPEANVQKAAEDLARQSIDRERSRAEEQLKAKERELRAQRAAEARGLLFFQHALGHYLDGNTDSARRLLDNDALTSVKVLQPLAHMLKTRLAGAAKAVESRAAQAPSPAPEQRKEAADPGDARGRHPSEESLARAAPPGMVPVHSGPFRMGFSGRGALENERPEHTAHLHFFYIDRLEVTCREYREFLIHIRDNKNAAQYAHKEQPAGWDHTPTSALPEDQAYVWNGVEHPAGMGDAPVTLVAWWDAWAYARFRGKRLPTEAEGEKAARGEDARLWPWGNAFEPSRCNSQEAGLGRPALVGSFPAGASPCGALDMSGNAAEWRQDWYKHNFYEESPTHNPGGPFTGQERVVRGGSFRSNETRVRAYKRSFYAPSLRFNDVGFRCAADPEE